MVSQPSAGARRSPDSTSYLAGADDVGNFGRIRVSDENSVRNLHLFLHRQAASSIREFARVFGVDFFSVISRGSQFKVESFMFRIAKPECFVLISPNKSDVSSFLSFPVQT
jgi:DNA polymerase elongation subunit (family B)